MMFRVEQLVGIKSGAITLAFRRWEKPGAKKGGTMKTAIGVIRVVDVEVVKESSIKNSDAVKAGFASVEEMMSVVNRHSKGEGILYKIKVAYESEDPRLELRERTDLTEEEFERLRMKLQRLDRTRGPWVMKVMKLIKRYPERRAGDLADMMQMDKFDFKINVRKLKNLGLTVSHEIGYSISPLGERVMERWKA